MYRLLASGLIYALLGPTAGCSFDARGLSITDLQAGVDLSTDGPAGALDLFTGDAPADASLDSPDLDALAPDGPSGPWWDVSWKRRRKLTFNNAARSQNLSNFPVLVQLTTARVDYSVMDPAGKDLRFVDQDHTKVLAHQIESWSAGGSSLIWVRVPQIDKYSSTDHIWVYYGNKGVADGQKASSVWDTSFAGVWHFAGNLKDSTANTNDAANHGSTPGASWLAMGQTFDGTNDYIELPNSTSLSLSVLTVELWFRTTQQWDKQYWPASGALISRATVGCNSNDWSVLGGRSFSDTGNTGRVLVGVGLGPSNICDEVFSSNTKKNDGQPHYLAWTRVSTGMNRLYIDGVLEQSHTDSKGSIAANRPIHVGGEKQEKGAYFKGLIDEVRISNVMRTPWWVDAQNASMTDVLISYGPEQSM